APSVGWAKRAKRSRAACPPFCLMVGTAAPLHYAALAHPTAPLSRAMTTDSSIACAVHVMRLFLAARCNEGQAMSDVHAAIDNLSVAAAALLEQVRAATADMVGVTRDAFGAKETAAGEILIEFCRKQNLAAGFDAVGNLAVTLGPNQRTSEIVLASHLDS